MSDIAKALLSMAARFASNEDEFGIFLQGFLAGAIATGPDLDATRAAMHHMVDVDEAFWATGALFESYLASKRAIEILAVRAPQGLRVMRTDVLNAVRIAAALDNKKGE